jgi:hypothetical protein
MPDFNVRSDAVNVEQIMEQIRGRIREKRGVDYTEAQIKELASVKLEKFLDPRGVRSDLLEQFRRAQPPYAPPELPNFAFEDETLFESTRGPLRFIRRLLLPILKLFFNPNPLIQALNIQAKLNAGAAEREAKRDAARYAFDQLYYEVMHNLVVETTRLGIEVKNLKMRLESLASRLEFNERRARALEGAVVYKPAVEERPPQESRRDEARREEARRQENRRGDQQARQPQPPLPSPASPETPATPQPDAAVATSAGGAASSEGPGQKSRRRRRRRGRRGSGAAAAIMAGAQQTGGDAMGDADQSDGEDSGLDTEMEVAGADDAVVTEEPVEEPTDEAVDSRHSRPEPFEHAFGAQAHPAETTASDPGTVAPAPAADQEGEQKPEEPTPSDPSVVPEQ